MAEMLITETKPPIVETDAPRVPAPPPDEENPAIEDARAVFLITAASAVVFVAIALLVTVANRMG